MNPEDLNFFFKVNDAVLVNFGLDPLFLLRSVFLVDQKRVFLLKSQDQIIKL